MPRSNSSVPRHRRHRKIVKLAKGYRGSRNSNFKTAKDAVEKGMLYAYRDRRQKKRMFRKLWIMRINAAVRIHGMSYSKFISSLKDNKIEINRKSLAHMAVHEPEAFSALIKNIS